MSLNNIKNKIGNNNFLLPILLIFIFTILGTIVGLYRGQLRYFFLFAGIGIMVSGCECVRILFPKNRQIFRRVTQAIVGGGLFLGISICAKVSFQFPEVVFDLFALITTGAVIQLVIARIIMPFFMGNAFCSWVCWDGAIFELMQSILPKSKNIKKRSIGIAIFYILFLVILASVVAYYGNPALNENTRWWWIVGENSLILSSGLVLSVFWGSRAYCRIFCPFITISGLISKYSIFKIKPVDAANCTGCNKCNKACPMLIDVKSFVKNGKSINARSCIVCERCVSSCEQECLKFVPGLPWK